MSFIQITPFAGDKGKMALSAHHIIAVQSHGDDGKTEVLMTNMQPTECFMALETVDEVLALLALAGRPTIKPVAP